MLPIIGMVFFALCIVGSIAIWNWLVPKDDDYHEYHLQSGKTIKLKRKSDGSLVDIFDKKVGEDKEFKRNKTIATIIIVVIWVVYFIFTIRYGGDADIDYIH